MFRLMKWIYEHPEAYNFLDTLISFGLSDQARKYTVKHFINKNKIETKVLEVGIGTAKSFHYIDNAIMFGVDIRKKMLYKTTKKTKKHVNLCLADACHLPFKDSSFDEVLFLFSFTNPEAIKEALRVGKEIIVLGYRKLPKLFELFGRKVFNNPNLRLEDILSRTDVLYSCKNYRNLFNIYVIKNHKSK